MERHKLTEIDHEARTARCSVCGPVRRLKPTGWHNGVRKWQCRTVWRRNNPSRLEDYKREEPEYVQYKGDDCENPECTATIEHPNQLDVHHKDGNRNNNDPANLKTLCANCHRLWHAPILGAATV